jgi:hypothetical protein
MQKAMLASQHRASIVDDGGGCESKLTHYPERYTLALHGESNVRFWVA